MLNLLLKALFDALCTACLHTPRCQKPPERIGRVHLNIMMLLQGGDLTDNNGMGGESIYGNKFQV